MTAAVSVGGGAHRGRVLNAFLDLILPPRCVGCARAGALVCASCAAELVAAPGPRSPSPPPPGLPECWAPAGYEGVARRAIIAYKERGRTALAGPLAECLAITLAAALGPPSGPVVLVPVPSSRAAVRRRGHDHLGRLAALAARRLRSRGWPVTVAPILAQCRTVRDQAGLSASQRAANLTGAFGVRRARGGGEGPHRGVPGRLPARAAVVLVDDVVTTGATLAEAAGALRREGMAVRLAVTLAATRRRAR